MKHPGQDPFDRPMRPDRVDAIRQAVEAFAVGATGVVVAKESETFENYQACVGHVIYQALAEICPDTMIAELQAGLNAAIHTCSAIFKSREDIVSQSGPPDNTAQEQG